MSKAVLYNEQGRITGNVYGPEEVCAQYILDHDDDGLFTEIDCSYETHYVENGQVVEKGEPPSDNYTFDYVSKSWVLDMSHAKQLHWDTIKEARDAEEFGTFEWNTHVFDCDEVSQRRIQGAVQLAALDNTTVMDWTLADNSVQTFNATELEQIGQALAAHVNACHVKARGLRAQIDAATTEAELGAIVW